MPNLQNNLTRKCRGGWDYNFSLNYSSQQRRRSRLASNIENYSLLQVFGLTRHLRIGHFLQRIFWFLKIKFWSLWLNISTQISFEKFPIFVFCYFFTKKITNSVNSNQCYPTAWSIKDSENWDCGSYRRLNTNPERIYRKVWEICLYCIEFQHRQLAFETWHQCKVEYRPF